MAITRYCPKCGLDRREGERFCRNCGTALGTGSTRLHASPMPSEPSPVAAAASATAPLPPVPPSPVLPAPPSGSHQVVPVPVAAPHPRRLPFKPLALVGGALLILATFLPWIAVGDDSTNALEVPLEALWNLNAADGPVKVGYATLLLGLLGAGLSFLPRTAWVRRLCGSIALALVAAFVLQLFRSVNQAGGSLGDLIDVMGVGVVGAALGALGLEASR